MNAGSQDCNSVFLVQWKANLLIFLSYVDGLVVNLLVNTKRASAVFIEK